MITNYSPTSAGTVSSNHIDYSNTKSKSYHLLSIGTWPIEDVPVFLTGDNVTKVLDFRNALSYVRYLISINRSMPDAIIGCYDENEAIYQTEFTSLLLSNERLSRVPFVLMEKDYNDYYKKNRKTITGIDDIIYSDIDSEEFYKKIELLKKYKSLRQGIIEKSKLQSNQIPKDRQAAYQISHYLKRIMDINIAVIGLFILLPIMAIIAILIKIDSRGPVFYTSSRAGSKYRIFKFIKFRTMVVEADNKLSILKEKNQYATTNTNSAVFFKISNDPRVTRIGKFLRNTSLDELPQLINVLKGDMSLVGNRPLPLYEAKELTTDLHAERFNAPAGITGLWQITKRGQKEMSVEERIALDINYARNNSFIHDLQIMLKTPRALMQKDNV